MRRSLVLFSSIRLSCLRVQLGRDIPDRRSRSFFDLHRNRDHPVSALGVLGSLFHHLAVISALRHEVAAEYQIGAPELSRHSKPPSDRSRSSRIKALTTRRIRLYGRRGRRGLDVSWSAPARGRPTASLARSTSVPCHVPSLAIL